MEKIRILITDDQAITRSGLYTLLETVADFEMVGKLMLMALQAGLGQENTL
ncbi:MAG: hypothetical protein M3Y81_09135 [Chloroflexota bacterium]|nr:hypothetical protein [Chloroflexota bacterium]